MHGEINKKTLLRNRKNFSQIKLDYNDPYYLIRESFAYKPDI